jgi:hypothetical protein
MMFRSTKYTFGLIFAAIAAQAQLAVTVFPLKVAVQKVLVPLTLANHLSATVQSARAVCFLLDDQGRMVGQSTKWVIGQNKTGLAAGATNSFNFVITSPQPFTSTNLAAKVSFSRVVLSGGALADLRKDVTVSEANLR